MNLTVSIVLAKLMGAAGVFLGTILSSLVVYLYSYPKYVCKPLFGMGYGNMWDRHCDICWYYWESSE